MKGEFKIEPKWKRSSEEIWADHFEKLTSAANEQSREEKGIVVKGGFSHARSYALYYAAAAIIILLIAPLVYTKNISAQRGEHLAHTLPDGSQVTINAQSELSYRPLLWYVSRDVKMEGEVLFKVKKGSDFTVKSDNGKVRVLGTTFNVISRDSRYEVTCIEGRVEVSAKTGEAERRRVIISGGEGVELKENEGLMNIPADKVVSSISWTSNNFYFTAVPLRVVLDEIARQYNVEIMLGTEEELVYTGNFSGSTSLEEVLEIVALPFSLKIEKRDKGYLLYREN